MSSLIDVSNSIKASITDKVTHPLLGSFIISWLFFNWKGVFFMLFANHDVVYRLKAVSENYSDLYLNLLFPLASSLALVFLLPMFTAGYTRFIAMTKEFQMKSLPEFFKPHSLTLDESNSLRDYYENEFDSLKRELERATSEITDYRTKHNSEITKAISNYKRKVNAVFDLFAAANINEKILNTQLTSQEIDQLTFLEQFLTGHLSSANLLSDEAYKSTESQLLLERNLSDELIENLDTGTLTITTEGIEALSNIKYKAFQKHYDTSTPDHNYVRESFN